MAALRTRGARARVRSQASLISIREIELTDAIERALFDVAGRSCLPILCDEIRRGVSQLWECRDGVHLLYVVTRLDQTPTEWVICWAKGSGVLKFIPQFLEVAKRRGWPVRMHTQSAAVVRLVRPLGGRMREYVVGWSHGPL